MGSSVPTVQPAPSITSSLPRRDAPLPDPGPSRSLQTGGCGSGGNMSTDVQV